MIITESVKSAFETVLTLEAQKEKLEADIKKARDTIRKAMDEQQVLQVKQDGYYANIAECSRSTLQKDEVAKLLGYAIPETCYKTTHYTTLTIKRAEMV